MASESAEEGSVTVSLGPELEEWLDARATALGVDRETVLLRLVATSRAADVDGVADAEDLADALAAADPVREAVATAADDVADDRIAAAIDAGLAERVEDAVAEQIAEALGERVDEAVADAVDERLEDVVTDAVESTLTDRLRVVEDDFQSKIEDVRERVIQVKQEADDKAPADHGHDALDRVDAIGGRLAEVEEAIDDLEQSVASVEDDLVALEAAEDEESALADTVEELQDRLKTVAWVVSDLREAHESHDGSAALEELKRSAARADASRANCESCGEGVEIGLLTEPRCPHCDATVTSVAPAEGFFGKPQLLVASQLESGEER